MKTTKSNCRFSQLLDAAECQIYIWQHTFRTQQLEMIVICNTQRATIIKVTLQPVSVRHSVKSEP